MRAWEHEQIGFVHYLDGPEIVARRKSPLT